MAGKQRNIMFIYFLIGVAIAGLIGVQTYWIYSGIRLQNMLLERSLKEDLQRAMHQMEEDTYCFSLNSKALVKHGEGIYIIKQKWAGGKFLGPESGGYLDTLNLYNVFYGRDTIFMNDKTVFFGESPSATLDVALKFRFSEFYPRLQGLDTLSYNTQNLTKDNYRDKLANKFTIDQIMDMQELDSLVKQSLINNNLDTVYGMGIKRTGTDQYEYIKPGTDAKLLSTANIKTTFLNDNRLTNPYEVALYIPGAFKTILGSMSAIVISSVIIIIFLVVSYIRFMRTMLKQKRLSEMKSTFINNITHEFRTPITNISLAVENWRDTANRNHRFYMDIIEEENRQMERNVEQILQIATLEDPAAPQRVARIDICELILETVNCFEIQLLTTGGSIEYRLNGSSHIVGNEDQLRNVLHNLLDNAIKYRMGPPAITIATYNAKNFFVLQVTDNGIGIPQEVQKYIFDRFYRGHVGDRHDVKGFGLGLSYVKYIIDMHKGKIAVKSKAGKGTQFTIYLPENLT